MLFLLLFHFFNHLHHRTHTSPPTQPRMLSHIPNRRPTPNLLHQTSLPNQILHLIAQPIPSFRRPIPFKLPGHENDALSVKEGDAAREHLDEQYTETPYVRGRVVHFVTGEAFWRHEHFCAEIVLGRVELVQYRLARVVQDSVSKVDQLDLIMKRYDVSARKANHRIRHVP